MDKSNSNIFKKMLLALAAGVLSVLGGAFMPPLLIPAAAVIGFIGNAYGTLYCGIALAVSLGGIAALLSSNVLTMLCLKTHTNKPVSIFHRFSFQQKFCRKFSTVSSLLLPKV